MKRNLQAPYGLARQSPKRKLSNVRVLIEQCRLDLAKLAGITTKLAFKK